VRLRVEEALAAGREQKSELLVDRGRVERVTGRERGPNATYVDTIAVVVPSGTRCRVKVPTTAAEVALAGEQAIVRRRYFVDFEWDLGPVLKIDDRLFVEESDDTWLTDPALWLTVVGVGLSGSTTGRRIVVEDRMSSAPSEVTS
jgi:hypothetical protein